MQTIICKCGCGRKKSVRVADVKRGWGKFYSKSCKAKAQERRTGQYKRHLNHKEKDDWEHYLDSVHPFSSEGLGQDGEGW